MTVPGDEPFVESAKALREVAKTTGKGIDAAREAGGFIARFIAGPLEQGIGIFEDKLMYSRWERQQRFMQRALEVQQELGLAAPDRAIPLKIAIPLFQGASIEEDDNLQDQWVNLLVNAAYEGSGVEVKRVYVEILSQISPLEAKILNTIYALPFNQIQYNGVITTDLPTGVQVGANEESQPVEPNDEIKLALANLARIGCLQLGFSLLGGEMFARVNPTVLGRYFVEACRIGSTTGED